MNPTMPTTRSTPAAAVRRLLSFLLAALALGGTGGCGVLTVDIDVYKGPLANHVDVQTQQAAVLALAAKPMLTKLRYRLELQARHPVTAVWTGDDADLLRTSDHYEEGFEFCSPQAAFVNRILAEYDTPDEATALREYLLKWNTKEGREELQAKGIGALSHYRAPEARGRPSPGLETLTTTYLIAKNDANEKGSHGGRIPERRFLKQEFDMFDGLVHFAERILFIADNDILFQERTGAVYDAPANVRAFLLGGQDANAAKGSYVRVLQAIGHSILVGLNELREEAGHRQRLAENAPREKHAAQTAFGQSPAEVMAGLLDSLKAELAAADKRYPPAKAKSRRQAYDDEAKLLRRSAYASALLSGQLAPGVRQKLTGSGNATGSELLALFISEGKAVADDQATSPAEKTKLTHAVAFLRLYQTDQRITAIKSATREKVANGLKKLFHDIHQVRAASTDARLSQRQLDNAARTVLAATPRVLALPSGAAPPGPPEGGAAAYGRLRQIVEDDLTKAQLPANAANVETTESLGDTIRVLAGRNPPATITLEGTEKTTKEVVGTVIAVLRYQYVEEVRQNGKDSARALQLLDAVEAATAQQGDMAYLRPASAYLRTSFPATSLQRDARLGWKNLLFEHNLRQLPLAELFANGDPQDYRTLLELDKQYWQNVNTVRVAGGGDTNYVVAKDDIGNWYVKNVSTDIEDIVKAGSSLALFSLGPALKGAPDLLAARRKQDAVAARTVEGDLAGAAAAATQPAATTQPTAGESGRAEPTSLVGLQLRDSKQIYDRDTQDHLDKARADAGGLQDAVTTAWQGAGGLTDAHRQTLTEPLKGAAKALTEAVAEVDKQDPAKTTPGDKVIDVLRTMRQFHNTLAASVTPALLAEPRKALANAQDEQKLKAAEQAKAAKKQADAQAKVDEVRGRVVATEPAAATQPSVSPELAQAIADNLRAVNEAASAQSALETANQAVRDATTAVAEAEKAAGAAVAVMRGVVRGKIVDTLEHRQRATNDYDAKLSLIGRAVGSP